MAVTPSTDTDPFQLGVGARRAARTRAVGAAVMVRGRRPGHQVAGPGVARNATLTTRYPGVDAGAAIVRLMSIVARLPGPVDAAGSASGPGARCPARPPPSPRPSPRRRPLGGAGVRAGGRADPPPPCADRESTVAAGVVLARGIPHARDGWLGTEAADGRASANACRLRRPGRLRACAGWSWATADHDRDGPSSSPSAPDASEEPRPVSFADAPVTSVLLDPA